MYSYGNKSKQQLAVMAAASATGYFVPPMSIYPNQGFYFNPLDGFEDAAFGRLETGWVDPEIFCQWLKMYSFHPLKVEKKGHRSL